MPRMHDLELPRAPASLSDAVKAWSKPVVIGTYLPLAPDKNPMFLEKRVYQGGSGKVYPLPFVDRIAVEELFLMTRKHLSQSTITPCQYRASPSSSKDSSRLSVSGASISGNLGSIELQ